MTKPGEGEENGMEVNSDRRNQLSCDRSRIGGCSGAGARTGGSTANGGKGSSGAGRTEAGGRVGRPIPGDVRIIRAGNDEAGGAVYGGPEPTDLDGLSQLFHYPFVTYEGIDTVVVNSRDELMSNPPPSLNTTGKGVNKIRKGFVRHPRYDRAVVLHPGRGRHITQIQPLRRQREKAAGVSGIYGMTNNDGKWGIEYMSTIFRPPISCT